MVTISSSLDVVNNDSGLTWEADTRHAELAVAELGLQLARPQTSAKPSTPLDHEELEPDGQKAYHSVSERLAHLAADRPDIAFACKECSRAVGKATRADLTRLKRIGRYLLHTPRAVREFPLQTEESIVTIDGLSDADAAGCTNTRRSTSGGCLRAGQHTLATWSSTQKVVSLSSAEPEYCSMVRCASEAIGLANTIRELGHEAHVRIWTDAVAARGLALRSGSGAIKHMETKYFCLAAAEREDDEASGWKTFGDVLKHISGRPSSAPKLAMETEYISRASRALAAMTLVRQAAASEIAVPSGAEYETWIDEHRINCWAMSGWITVVIMTCCILMGLVLLWWKSGRVAETIDRGTQTLEEGRCSQDVLPRIMVTKHGKAAHYRNDCPFLLKDHVIQSLSWCSHCDPNDALEKRAWRRRIGL